MKKLLLLITAIALVTLAACDTEVNVYLDASDAELIGNASSADNTEDGSETDTGGIESGVSSAAGSGEASWGNKGTPDNRDEDKKPSGGNDDKKTADSSKSKGTQGPTPNVAEYTVTFNSAGGSAVPADRTSGKVTKPADPTRAGYRFLGWYKQGGDTAWDFNQNVGGDMTLVARWEIIEHTVTFDSAGGSAVSSDRTSGKVTKPADPTRAGYVFSGWYKQGSDTAWDFNQNVSEDMTLVARWGAIGEYNVTFETGDGSKVPPSRTSGGRVVRPADPTYLGYRFLGWKEKGAKDAWDFNKTVSGDITLVAMWGIGGDTGSFIPL